jgi:HlyD family secretion protein
MKSMQPLLLKILLSHDMKNKKITYTKRRTTSLIPYLLLFLVLISCKKNNNLYDASGVFESDEVILSSEINGKLISSANEGSDVIKGQTIALIDDSALLLQKEQLKSSLQALYGKQNDSNPQSDLIKKQKSAQEQNLLVLKEQLRIAEKEKSRIKNLVAKDAVPVKQLDDIDGQVSVILQQIESAKAQLSTFDQQVKTYQQTIVLQNKNILSEKKPMEVKILTIDDQIKRCKIVSPIEGNVMVKYLENGEVATVGKPIMKIAKMNALIVRAYVTSSQLALIKLNQNVNIYTGKEPRQKKYIGQITWISSKAEFTPKTIQTIDERENLVYAIKVQVPNDGFLKIGMYADLKF